jgi:hypothetical protein
MNSRAANVLVETFGPNAAHGLATPSQAGTLTVAGIVGLISSQWPGSATVSSRGLSSILQRGQCVCRRRVSPRIDAAHDGRACQETA